MGQAQEVRLAWLPCLALVQGPPRLAVLEAVSAAALLLSKREMRPG